MSVQTPLSKNLSEILSDWNVEFNTFDQKYWLTCFENDVMLTNEHVTHLQKLGLEIFSVLNTGKGVFIRLVSTGGGHS